MRKIDVRGVGRESASDKEVVLFFDRALTDEEMLSLREDAQKMFDAGHTVLPVLDKISEPVSNAMRDGVPEGQDDTGC